MKNNGKTNPISQLINDAVNIIRELKWQISELIYFHITSIEWT